MSVILSPAWCRGETAFWSEPALDTWAYTNGFGGGFRGVAPSFGGVFLDESETALEPTGSTGPSRLGSFLMAFETIDQVETDLDPQRYAIHSATVTVRMDTTTGGSISYEDQPTTTADLLAQAQAGEISAQQAVELFGVGFRNGYEGFALGSDTSGQRFDEASPVYSGSAGYSAFPVVVDEAGGLVDVSNNLTGGFSATADGGETAPFDATPWSIGDPGVAPGQTIAAYTTFQFDLDLSLPGVTEYLQQGLSAGAVGFYLSSVHPASQPDTGGSGAYPQWYAKEAVGAYLLAEAPTLTIDYETLPIPGDYDGDGLIQENDLLAWKSAYGGSVITPGSGADGNADGVVDTADYVVWRNAFTAAAPAAIAVPEPGAGGLVLIGLATMAFCSGTILYTSPRGPKE